MRLFELEPFELPYAEALPTDSVGRRLEMAKAEAYEQGYAAGVKSASAEYESRKQQNQERLVQSLTALRLTREQASHDILLSMESLLNDIVAALLPAIARKSLCGFILSELMPLVGRAAEAPVIVASAPDVTFEVEEMLAARNILSVQLVPDPELSSLQAELKGSQTELRIDLGGAITSIGEAIADFFAVSRLKGMGDERE